jgi:hypothetical protein
MALTLIQTPGFEPKRRFPCPEFRMEAWLPPHDHAELCRRARVHGITAREYAMQAVRYAMAQDKTEAGQ